MKRFVVHSFESGLGLLDVPDAPRPQSLEEALNWLYVKAGHEVIAIENIGTPYCRIICRDIYSAPGC